MMALTTHEDFISAEMEKQERSTGRCEFSAKFLDDVPAADAVRAELDTLALQIENVKKAVRRYMEITGHKTPVTPDQPLADTGAGK